MSIKKHIPNLITSGNLFCGVLAIPFALDQQFETVGLLVMFALIFDFLDGFVARLLKVSSPIGKDLDSLADMVTFGVLPGIVAYVHLINCACDPNVCTGLINRDYLPYLAFIIPVFSALRLAKFNNDPRQSDSFYGVPTPANAAFFISIPLIQIYVPDLNWITGHPKVIAVSIVMMSYLLVADVQLLALKFKNFSLKDNVMRYVLIVGSLVLIVFFEMAAVPLIIGYYVLLSVLANSLKKEIIQE